MPRGQSTALLLEAFLLAVCCSTAGCTQPLVARDGEVASDAGPAPDAGDDAGASDAGDEDAAAMLDAGVRRLRAVGSIVSIGGPTRGGTLVVVDQGFETGGLACTGTTCVVGGIEP